MDDSLRLLLTGVAKKHGWATDDASLIDILIEAKECWTGNEDEHRHWIEFDKVVEVEGRFFRYAWAKGAGDQGIYDAGWKFDPETIIEVKPETKTVTVTEYVQV